MLSTAQREIDILKAQLKLAYEDLAGYTHMKIEFEQYRQQMIKAQNLLNAFADENKLFHEFLNDIGGWRHFNQWQKNKKDGRPSSAVDEDCSAIAKDFKRMPLGENSWPDKANE